MAIRREVNKLQLEDTHYLSDESDFYGDEATKQDFERRAQTFDPQEWWNQRVPTPEEVADAKLASTTSFKGPKLYNPYEGVSCARQLSETTDEFLKRLPPATTQLSSQIPWIFVTNPFREAPKKFVYEQEKMPSEGPQEENSDTPKFVVEGGKILAELTQFKQEIEKNSSGKAKTSITRAFNTQRDAMVNKLLDTAVELHLTSGKWMIFCSPSEVNEVWEVVARNTVNNELGIAAKVAPDDGEARKDRLICIYTKDFTDIKDVSRILHKLKDLGVIETRGRGIYYKCDAYTYLGLTSKNDYDIKASLYSSTEIFRAASEKSNVKLDGFFYKKKKYEGDWRPLE